MAMTSVLVMLSILFIPLYISSMRDAARGCKDLESLNYIVGMKSSQKLSFDEVLSMSSLPAGEKAFLEDYWRAKAIFIGPDGFFYWGSQGNTRAIQEKFSCVKWVDPDTEFAHNVKTLLFLFLYFSMFGVMVCMDRCSLRLCVG